MVHGKSLILVNHEMIKVLISMNKTEKELLDYQYKAFYKSNRKKVWFFFGIILLLIAFFTTDIGSGKFWFAFVPAVLLLGVGTIIVCSKLREGDK